MTAGRAIDVTLAIGLVAGLWAGLASSCSGQNQEGPEVTCAELECGRKNACQEGIIAQCLDGETVRYHACGTDPELCEADWQVPDQYRCSEATTDCEGCRPERAGCDLGEGGTSGAAGGGGATSSTGGAGTGGAGGA